MQNNPRAKQKTEAYRYTVGRPAESNAVAVGVGNRRWVLVHGPELCRVARVAFSDVQNLRGGFWDDALGGNAPIAVRNLRGNARAGDDVESGWVVGRPIAWDSDLKVRVRRSSLWCERKRCV